MSKEEKDQYVKSEIADKGLDSEKFKSFIEAEKINLKEISMEDLQKAVEKFQASEKDSDPTLQDGVEYENICGIIPGTGTSDTDKLIFQIFGNEFDNYEIRLESTKLESNELTKKSDLYVNISNPIKMKHTFHYSVKTKPIGYDVMRSIDDFKFLFEHLHIYHKGAFIPLLPKFPFGLSDDSEKKILYFRFFMNSIIENEYFRSLPIVLDFLSKPLEEWNKLKKKVYDKEKENKEIHQMPSLDGFYDLKINSDDCYFVTKIQEKINSKEEAYIKFNKAMDELFPVMDKMGGCLKNISAALLELKNQNNDAENLSGCFQQLFVTIKNWGEDYLKQKNYLKNELKYFFKYMNKENISFKNNLKNYKTALDDYQGKFKNLQKNTGYSEKEKILLNGLKNNYAFHLVFIIDEYNKLKERQGTRAMKQFFNYNKNKEVLFQDYNNIHKLFGIRENYSLPSITSANVTRIDSNADNSVSKINFP